MSQTVACVSKPGTYIIHKSNLTTVTTPKVIYQIPCSFLWSSSTAQDPWNNIYVLKRWNYPLRLRRSKQNKQDMLHRQSTQSTKLNWIFNEKKIQFWGCSVKRFWLNNKYSNFRSSHINSRLKLTTVCYAAFHCTQNPSWKLHRHKHRWHDISMERINYLLIYPSLLTCKTSTTCSDYFHFTQLIYTW